MGKIGRTFFLLLAAIAAAGCDRAIGEVTRGKSTATITRSWPASEIAEVEIFDVSGNIDIEAAPTEEVRLVAKVRGRFDANKADENDGLFATSLEAGELEIGRPTRRRGVRIPFVSSLRGDDTRIDYMLQIPPTVSVSARTVNGRITSRGVGGEMKATSVNGRIDVEVVGGNELAATTVNGRIKARFRDSFSGARLKSVNGGVTAWLPETASFRVDLKQVNGGFEASFPLSIHSNPSSRRVSGEVNGGAHPLKITTVNGHVSIERAALDD